MRPREPPGISLVGVWDPGTAGLGKISSWRLTQVLVVVGVVVVVVVVSVRSRPCRPDVVPERVRVLFSIA